MIAAKTSCEVTCSEDFLIELSYWMTSHILCLLTDNGVYASDIATIQPGNKFATKEKIEDKILVWIAIDPKGLSHPFIRKSGFGFACQWATTFE